MIRLEHLEKEDLKEIVEWNANKSADYLTQWAGPSYSYPLALEQIENCFFYDSKKYDSNINAYKIRITDTDEFIGAVELREIDRSNDYQTIYLKNVITRDDIKVGDYTIYNDFYNDPRDFEKNNVLYQYSINNDKLIICLYIFTSIFQCRCDLNDLKNKESK